MTCPYRTRSTDLCFDGTWQRLQNDWASSSTERNRLVHGDLTTLNVLVDGSPARVSGLIDFNNAYLEMPLADVGFSLWQAGRPAHDDYTLDSRRVSDLVADTSASEGYRCPRRMRSSP